MIDFEYLFLVATSTLAMGVNLPAHLVIIKSTMYYNMGSHQEYPDTQVLQMIGRAGRPQFDTSATAVIMTKNSTKVCF
jgi:ATP-dependent DNA helicase HFM1/MER3